MAPRAVTTRDAGLALISRINRWVIVGAVALSGVISLVAARSFHGRTVASSGSAISQPAQSPSSSGGSDSGGSRLAQPTQAPSPSPAQSAPAPVVSGGS